MNKNIMFSAVRTALCVILFFSVSCEYKAPKYEIARRTQCMANIKQVAESITLYKKSTGHWPSSISDLNLVSVPHCPSAAIGDKKDSLDGRYSWDLNKLELAENIGNHDPNRLKLTGLSNVIHAAIFDTNGNFHVERR